MTMTGEAVRTVRDIMRTDVVSVRPDTSAQQLMGLLAEEGISGAPVVDEDGKVVGVVSVSDVLRLASAARPETGAGETRLDVEAEEEGARAPGVGIRGRGGAPAGFFYAPEGPLHHFPGIPLLRTLGIRLETTPVRRIMTPATFSVRPDATVPELAAFLLRAGIHRALVFEGSALRGIVSAFDVLRVVADEAGEGTAERGSAGQHSSEAIG